MGETRGLVGGGKGAGFGGGGRKSQGEDLDDVRIF